MANKILLNIAGEGEVPGVLNQQPPFALLPGWVSTTIRNPQKTISELVTEGHDFLICPNERLSLADESVDVVYTNNVRIDGRTFKGPTPQSSEIKRILKPGGIWIHDGRVRWRKP